MELECIQAVIQICVHGLLDLDVCWCKKGSVRECKSAEPDGGYTTSGVSENLECR